MAYRHIQSRPAICVSCENSYYSLCLAACTTSSPSDTVWGAPKPLRGSWRPPKRGPWRHHPALCRFVASQKGSHGDTPRSRGHPVYAGLPVLLLPGAEMSLPAFSVTQALQGAPGAEEGDHRPHGRFKKRQGTCCHPRAGKIHHSEKPSRCPGVQGPSHASLPGDHRSPTGPCPRATGPGLRPGKGRPPCRSAMHLVSRGAMRAGDATAP